MNNIKKGFSLVELLISLIVISCITAAFTPLITKKFATNIGFGGGGGGGDIPSIMVVAAEAVIFLQSVLIVVQDIHLIVYYVHQANV